MTDAIPQAIVVLRPDGTPAYANQVMLEYTGLTPEDLQAEGFRERIFHPHDLERVRDEREKALAIGEPFEIEQRAQRSDGQYRWFLIRYNPCEMITGISFAGMRPVPTLKTVSKPKKRCGTRIWRYAR